MHFSRTLSLSFKAVGFLGTMLQSGSFICTLRALDIPVDAADLLAEVAVHVNQVFGELVKCEGLQVVDVRIPDHSLKEEDQSLGALEGQVIGDHLAPHTKRFLGSFIREDDTDGHHYESR